MLILEREHHQNFTIYVQLDQELQVMEQTCSFVAVDDDYRKTEQIVVDSFPGKKNKNQT